MDVSPSFIEAADAYYVFAFDEGTEEQIKEAKILFNEHCNEAYQAAQRDALMKNFHRPTSGEFRDGFIQQCRAYLRRVGKI